MPNSVREMRQSASFSHPRGGPSNGVTKVEPPASTMAAPRAHFDNGVSNGSSAVAGNGAVPERTILGEEDCDQADLACGFSEWKKWTIITTIVLVQISMNLNTSLYSNAIKGISSTYQVSEQVARLGAMIFLVLYAFGCELWAPFSEEFGRKSTLQLSLFLVNVWQLPVALAPNFTSVMVGRALGGLCSAGGSVTLGIIADLWDADGQQYAVAFVVFSSVAGSIVGPVVGGFVETYLDWQWAIWIQLIFGVAVQFVHMVAVPETRSTLLINKIAKQRRDKPGNAHIFGPTEGKPLKDRFSRKEIFKTWLRPFSMFFSEPIVLTLSLLSGFSDAIIFMFFQSFSFIYSKWNFDSIQIGLAFVPLLVGYLIAWGIMVFAVGRNIKERRQHPEDEKAQYESRLLWLLWTAPLLPLGLIGGAWVPHWAASMVCSVLVGIANFAIYGATIDYLICSYGVYSASATGGNGFARDLLAGVLTPAAVPFFSDIGSKPVEYANTILFCISLMLVAAVFVIYYYGPTLRRRSMFAQWISKENKHIEERRQSRIMSRPNSIVVKEVAPGTAV